MSTWVIYHTDGSEGYVEADSVSVAGTIMGFLEHSKISTADGKIQGIPIAFIDLSNPTVRLVEMLKEKEPKDAKVVSIV